MAQRAESLELCKLAAILLHPFLALLTLTGKVLMEAGDLNNLATEHAACEHWTLFPIMHVQHIVREVGVISATELASEWLYIILIDTLSCSIGW